MFVRRLGGGKVKTRLGVELSCYGFTFNWLRDLGEIIPMEEAPPFCSMSEWMSSCNLAEVEVLDPVFSQSTECFSENWLTKE